MSVSLVKGSAISLSKVAKDVGASLDNVSVGLGWDMNNTLGMDFDIDAWALAIREDGIKTKDLVYYSNMNGAANCIHHMGDNLTGEGDGDDEVINIELSKLPEKYKYILIGITIFRARNRKQSFKDIDNTFIRVYDTNTNVEICKYSDEFKQSFADETSILFGVFFKKNNQWQFGAIGKGENISTISDALNKYDKFSLENYNLGGKKNMAVSLSKGGKVSLAKVAADAGVSSLTKITVGLGWNTNRYDGGADFDLDASAFCCGSNGKVTCDEDFVFYNNKVRPGVEHMGDNRTGDGDGDDEVINIDLTALPANIDEINFTVTINDADKNNQNFGMVEDSYVRILDQATGTELIRYDLGEDFSIETAIVVAKLYKNNGEWKFNAIGSGFAGGLAALCNNFGVNV